MNRPSPKGVLKLFKESIIGWNQNEAMLHAAALAYYTISGLQHLGVILWSCRFTHCRAVVGLLFSLDFFIRSNIHSKLCQHVWHANCA
jgi:hypothetical protein